MFVLFFFKQKTAYELRISDWSSDVCSSDLDSEQKFPTGSQKVVRPLRNTAVLGLNGGDIHCRLALCFVAKANHCALPARQGAFDSRGGPMKNGTIGRASCRDRVCQYV